jgi:dolichyl-phosphate-mannose-protein mannosyltransferase
VHETRLHWNDIVSVLALTALAAVMAFSGLGSRSAARTYWSTVRAGETVLADAGAGVPIDRVSCWVGLGEGAVEVEVSSDGTSWTRVGTVEQPDAFGFMEWRVLLVPAEAAPARYLRLVALRPGLEIGEVGAFGLDGSRISLRGIAGPGEPFDEQRVVVRTPTARTGMYFDETYFARSAWQQLRGLPASETSHPPLGRTIISLGVAAWGMNPWGWRFMGAVAGTLSVAVLYLVARRLLGRTAWAGLAGLLFAVDFLRFAQSRMATVDVFVMLFTLLASWFVLEHSRGPRPWPWLLATGVALGAGIAVKWSAAFPAFGVAVLSLAAESRRIRETAPPDRATAAAAAAGRVLVCLVVVPLVVYAAAWLPDMLAREMGVRDVVARHVAMYRYHAAITETRWYASAWWQWPLDLRPIWLYQGVVDVPAGRIASVVTMGNPVVWWSGLAAVPVLAASAFLRRDRVSAWLLVAFLCSWLPWALSARKLTFIYHFLPATPFLALGLAHGVHLLVERFPRARPVPIVIAAAAAAAFALFLPLLTGMPVPRAYAEALRWLSTWIFFT